MASNEQQPREGRKCIFVRVSDGLTERVEWIRCGDTVRIVAEGQETVVGPREWKQAWADLEARGFVQEYPTFPPQITADTERVANLIRSAFQGVTLGEGVGLREANGLDDYADEETLAAYRAQDEKNDWSAISAEELNRYSSSPSFFDAEAMRFHLPAYLLADLDDRLTHTDILFHLVCFEHEGMSRFEKFTDAQRYAVRQYLLLRLSDPHYDFHHPLIEKALNEYWMLEQEP